MPSLCRRLCSEVRYGAIFDSGRLIYNVREIPSSPRKTYFVKIKCLNGLSLGGGSGRKGTKLSSNRWNSPGMPGRIHSLPSSLTTGLHKSISQYQNFPRLNINSRPTNPYAHTALPPLRGTMPSARERRAAQHSGSGCPADASTSRSSAGASLRGAQAAD